MGRLRRKRTHHAHDPASRHIKTKRRTKDLDQIFDDVNDPETKQKLEHQEVDEDLPGLGQHYCVHCAKYFIDDKTLTEHFGTKNHKRQVKKLLIQPYRVEDSQIPVDNGKKLNRSEEELMK
eukprot:TRINITY_DN1551_c0_g1_i1.p1 TRINITY_DN1551_c0_g1~~TRINITY_DN1551_c0_g1_i1.p1  ORF type:complete len:121 (-),score=17.12 TRINITY_DN1551_c0_g1_i1:29-391(-)